MSNLKKILALVLALVMSFSLVSVSSAAYEDQDQIDAKYADAVEVLTGIGIFQGDNGNFKPKAPITRQEVAAMMYRVISMDVTDASDELYVDACTFTDVTANWAKGFIGYCANGGYIKGHEGKFNPQGNISGVAVLAMILRAVGYDKNGEFTGPNWENEVLTTATSLGILAGIDETVGSLKKDASRELVAQLIFNAMTMAKKVNYTLAFGYQPIVDILQNSTTIGYDNFKLAYDKVVSHDTWGRPYHVWYADTVDQTGDLNKTTEYNAGAEKVYAKIEYVAKATYNTAVCECDISKALGLSKDTTIVYLSVNANQSNTVVACDKFDGTFNLVHTNKMVGGQGRLTEVYKTANGYEVVMIDEFLALVTGVTEVQYDINGHIKQHAQLHLEVFDKGTTALNGGTDLVLESTSNWTYTVGQFLTLNAKTVGTNATSAVKADYTMNKVDETYMNLAVANSVEGVQSALTTKASHWIDGVEYPDNIRLGLDQAGKETTKHVWFFDTMGNVLGIADAVNVFTYGTISAIAWKDSYTDLTKGYALAQITYVDGSSETVKIAKIDGQNLFGVEGTGSNYAQGLVSSTMQYNDTYKLNDGTKVTAGDYTNIAMYQIFENAAGYKELVTVTALVDGNVQTGVPFMGATAEGKNYHAGNNTQFLVWTGVKYETYTGIKNVPTYYDNGTSSIWVVDRNDDTIAEYVFINEADLASAYTYGLFYAHTNNEIGKELYVTKHLYNSTEYYWTIHNGYVNGTATTLDVLDEGVANFIVANAGKLMTVSLIDELVYAAEIVTGDGAYVSAPLWTYVTYAGAAKDAVLGQNVLIADGVSYDIENATVIYDEYNLQYTVNNKLDDAYLYVVYTVSPYTTQKTASFIYVSNTLGKAEADKDDLDTLIAALEEAIAELEAAVKAAKTYVAAAATASTLLDDIYDAIENVGKAYDAYLAKVDELDNDDDFELTAEQKVAVADAKAVIDDYIAITVKDGANVYEIGTKSITVIQDTIAAAYVKAIVAVADAETKAEKAAAAELAVEAVALMDAADKDGLTISYTLPVGYDADDVTAMKDAAAEVKAKEEKAAVAEKLETLESDLFDAVKAKIEKDNKADLIYATVKDADIAEAVEDTLEALYKDLAKDQLPFATVKALEAWMNGTEATETTDATKGAVATLAEELWAEASTLVATKKAACQDLDKNVYTHLLSAANATKVKAVIEAAQEKIQDATTAKAITEAKAAAIKELDALMVEIYVALVGTSVEVEYTTVVTAKAIEDAIDEKVPTFEINNVGYSFKMTSQEAIELTITRGEATKTVTVAITIAAKPAK